MTIVVFGSLNIDFVIRAAEFPAPGETLTGTEFKTFNGGKGANQSAACTRLGAETVMIGCVGSDSFGSTLREHMSAEGVNTASLRVVDGEQTGSAFITVNRKGQNTIIVVPGANGAVGLPELTALETHLSSAQVLMLQLEVPLEVVGAAATLAYQQGVPVILDPAPAQTLPDELYRVTSILTPNEHEAGILAGFDVTDQKSAARAAALFIERGCEKVIIKMGSQGAYWQTRTDSGWIDAFRVTAIDTVAAGDAFNAGVAAAIVRGLDWHTSLRWGAAAGALATTKTGAQSSLPTHPELEALLQAQP